MVINGLGTVLAGQIIILDAPNMNTPQNNCGGTFQLTWAAVANATSYILQRSTNGGAWVTIYQGANLSYQETNLAPGTYQYQVIAVKGAKQSPPQQTATVQVLQQGNIGSPYRLGDLLVQDVRVGCNMTQQQLGRYGCTDPTAANYNSLANINEGCYWNGKPCDFYFPPFWTTNPLQSSYTVTATLPCATDGGTGVLTGVSFSSTPVDRNTTILSATYAGNVGTIVFTVTDYWNWVTFHITGTQRTA